MSTLISETQLDDHKVVSFDEWIAASAELLAKEKEFTRIRDEMARVRRTLPWVRVEEDYIFEGPDGPVALSELFDGKSQLIIYHAMWGSGEKIGCTGCSFVCDHIDSARQHFEHHDIAITVVSHGERAEFAAFKERMGWTFRWVSSADTSFNYDFDVSFRPEDLAQGPVRYNFAMQKLRGPEQPGLSAFYKNESGEIFRTYSTYERGLDLLLGAYNYIDLTAKGRNESGPMDWVEFHDQYKDKD